MRTDLESFHEAFFEESLEAIDSIESGLLNLDVNANNSGEIDTIFRAAHSIKGCSATFGFAEVASFVHVMETTLDEMRAQALPATQNLIDLLLKAVDVLRGMLKSTQAGTSIDSGIVESIAGELTEYLNAHAATLEGLFVDTDSLAKNIPLQSSSGWEIHVLPDLGILKTGNDPLRLFRVLSEFGDVETVADTDCVLDFRSIDPEDCYLSWKLESKGETGLDDIKEVFEWIEDDCKITIHPLAHDAVEQQQPQSQPAPQQTSPRHKAGDAESHTTGGDSVSIRVGIDKVDDIINMVGELVITQSMLDQLGYELQDDIVDSGKFEKLRSGLIQLERNTRELQESVMRIRMLPISYVFNRVPRIVHDLSNKLNKNVNIKMSGESTELDKTVLEKIGDPLVHLVRNAIDHGIESPQQRRVAQKPETGTISLNAFHKGGNIIIEIKDDGAGLNKNRILETARKRDLVEHAEAIEDRQLFELIFHPGFSTADAVSDVSGRGVGMDVVKKNIKMLGGNIEVTSTEGEGTCFTIRLPLTLAILDGQLVRVGSQTYIIPLISIIESLQVRSEHINQIAGQAITYRLRDEYIPVLLMGELFGVTMDSEWERHRLMVVVEGDGKKMGLVVDDLLGQQQIVIKSLETNYKRVEGVSGATILGDGTVALIADISGLIGLSHKSAFTSPSKQFAGISNFAAA